MSTPVDVGALAEALEGSWTVPNDTDRDQLGVIVAAARAFLESPTADYCWTHDEVAINAVWLTGGCWKQKYGPPCKVGRVRLVAEEETG